jgi:hypothetical protein
MELLPGDLTAAASGARERFAQLSLRTAEANLAPHGTPPAGAMASAAREAIFADALLGALRGRLEELKNVTK